MNRWAATEVFLRIMETRSFSATARQLRIGQPTVSKMIAQLEKHLGVPLLIRTTQTVSPTEAGKVFYERAKRVVQAVDEAENAARGTNASLSGELRVSAAVTFARLHLIPKIANFLAEHPQLNLQLMLDDQNIDLVEAGIQVALRMGTQEDSSLTARKIAQCPRLVLATPAYFEKKGEPTTPAELATHDAVIYDVGGGGTSWTFRKGSTKASLTVSGRLRITAAEGVREAVLSGAGLTIGSEWMFSPELATGTVRATLRDWTLPPMQLWAVFPPGRRVGAKASAFVTFVEDALKPVIEGCDLSAALIK